MPDCDTAYRTKRKDLYVWVSATSNTNAVRILEAAHGKAMTMALLPWV